MPYIFKRKARPLNFRCGDFHAYEIGLKATNFQPFVIFRHFRSVPKTST